MALRIDERKVRVHMAAVGINTQEELARRAKISSVTLRKLFRGDGFYSVTLNDLARALECNPIDLLAVDGFPDPHMGAPAMAVNHA